MNRYASNRDQKLVLRELEFWVASARENNKSWLSGAPSNRQFTLSQWDPGRKKCHRTKVTLARDIDHVRTCKKLYYGPALNATGSRPSWPEPRTFKIVPLELLTPDRRVFNQEPQFLPKMSQTHVAFKIIVYILEILLGVVMTSPQLRGHFQQNSKSHIFHRLCRIGTDPIRRACTFPSCT